jgi:hypothetical protein
MLSYINIRARASDDAQTGLFGHVQKPLHVMCSRLKVVGIFGSRMIPPEEVNTKSRVNKGYDILE